MVFAYVRCLCRGGGAASLKKAATRPGGVTVVDILCRSDYGAALLCSRASGWLKFGVINGFRFVWQCLSDAFRIETHR